MPTAKLALPYYTDGQTAPQATLSEQLNALDAAAVPKTLTWQSNTPPGSPADGDIHLTGSSPTGAWSGQAGKIALYYSGWKFYTPLSGARLYRVEATNKHRQGVWVYDETDGWFPTWRMWDTTEHWTGRYVGLAGDITNTPAKVWRKCVNISAFPNAGVVNTSYGGSLVIDRTYPVSYELLAVQSGSNTLPTPAPIGGLPLDIVFYSTAFDLVAVADMSTYVGTLCLEYVKDT